MPYEHGGFHLVEQYRYPLGTRTWEFPSGSFPPGVTGTPEEMAAAELVEESGITAGSMARLGFLHCANALSGLGAYVFLATDLTAGEPRRETTEQDMRQDWFPRAEVERMIRDGVITDAASVAAYFLVALQ